MKYKRFTINKDKMKDMQMVDVAEIFSMLGFVFTFDETIFENIPDTLKKYFDEEEFEKDLTPAEDDDKKDS